MAENDQSNQLDVRSELEQEYRLSFIGFTIFDIGHILIAVIGLFYAFIVREAGYQVDVGECIAELIFAALLISFVDALAGNTTPERFRKNYTYAFLCASAALLVPLAMSFPYVIEELSSPSNLLYFLAFITTAIALVLIFIALFLKSQQRVWRVLVVIGVIFFVLYSPLMLIQRLLDPKIELTFFIQLLHRCLPLVPAVIGMIRLFRHSSQSVLY